MPREDRTTGRVDMQRYLTGLNFTFRLLLRFSGCNNIFHTFKSPHPNTSTQPEMGLCMNPYLNFIHLSLLDFSSLHFLHFECGCHTVMTARCLLGPLFTINETSPGTKMQQLAVKSISPHCYYRVDISLGRRVLIRDDRRLAAIGLPDIPHPSSHG